MENIAYQQSAKYQSLGGVPVLREISLKMTEKYKTQDWAYASWFNKVLNSFRVHSTAAQYYETNIGLYMIVNKNGEWFIKKIHNVYRESGGVMNI